MESTGLPVRSRQIIGLDIELAWRKYRVNIGQIQGLITKYRESERLFGILSNSGGPLRWLIFCVMHI